MTRHQLNKLTKNHSTKSERRFSELLKELHIPFQTKVKINNKEVDFLIGRYVIELDGHEQDVSKNKEIIELGYNVIHFSNWNVNSLPTKEWLKTIWDKEQERVYSPPPDRR